MIKSKDPAAPDTIVLIHGLWLTALSWEHWVTRYAGLGYRVIARNWPGMEGSIDDFRRDPSAVAGLGIGDVVDHYEKIVRELHQPPVIIGHSFGGLITEMLLDRGLGAAGVAIDPAPVKGVFALPFSELKAGFPGLKNPFSPHQAVAISPEQFNYAFTNHLTAEESLPLYQRYSVPGPNYLLWQASLANFNPHAATTVNFNNDTRAPLLLIAGGRDHTAPAVVTKANYNLFGKSKAVTAYREYPDRTHWTIAQDGWEEVADYALEWSLKNALLSTVARAKAARPIATDSAADSAGESASLA